MILYTGRQIQKRIVTDTVPFEERITGAYFPRRAPRVVVKVAYVIRVRLCCELKCVSCAKEEIVSQNHVAPHRTIIPVTISIYSAGVMRHDQPGCIPQ